MLETPISGRYAREERYLTFEPALPYMALVYGCVYAGGFFALSAVIGGSYQAAILWGAVCLAGIWAHLSVPRIRFDTKTRQYRRRQGPGFIPRLWTGPTTDLDAIVVIAEPSVLNRSSVNYYVVLNWKQQRAPLMVIEKQTILSSGHLQMDGRGMVAKAVKYGQSLGVPVYDNTHFPSPCPIPVF